MASPLSLKQGLLGCQAMALVQWSRRSGQLRVTGIAKIQRTVGSERVVSPGPGRLGKTILLWHGDPRLKRSLLFSFSLYEAFWVMKDPSLSARDMSGSSSRGHMPGMLSRWACLIRCTTRAAVDKDSTIRQRLILAFMYFKIYFYSFAWVHV